jgi:hypothetical protein
LANIALVTDSMSLPRRAPEQLAYGETYAALVAARYGIDILHCAQGGAAADALANQMNYLAGSFDFFIFHFGIVDCAPRALSRVEVAVLRRLPFNVRLPRGMIRFLRRHRGVRMTRPAAYRAYAQAMRNAAGCHCLAIATAPVTTEYESRVPGIGASVSLYNEILADVFGDAYVAVDFDPQTYLMSDGMHMNADGHRWLATALISALDRNAAFAAAIGKEPSE